MARHQAGDWSGAELGWRAALAVAPDDAWIHYYLADALHRLGRAAEAIGHYRQAVATDPGIIEAQFNLGCLLQEVAGEGPEAVACFRAVLQTQPDNLHAAVRLCRIVGAKKSGAAEADRLLADHRARVSGPAARLLDAAHPQLAEMRQLLMLVQQVRAGQGEKGFATLAAAPIDPLAICRIYMFGAEFARTAPPTAPILRLLVGDTSWKGHRYILFQWIQQMVRMGLLQESPDHRLLSRQVLDRLIEEYRPAAGITTEVRRGERRIAILSGHFRSVETHAVTSAVRDFTRHFNHYGAQAVRIFATDPYEAFDSERHFCFTEYSFGRSAQDSTLARYVSGMAEVRTIDPTLPRDEAIAELIREIVAFEPSLIVCASAQHDLVRELLYEHYPVLDIPVMDPLQPNRADAVFTIWPQALIRRMAETFAPTAVPVEQHFFAPPVFALPVTVVPERKDAATRAALQLGGEDFVLVSVGTRLIYDLRPEFFERVCSFLQEAPDAVWLLVGSAELLENRPPPPELAARIRAISWVQDLGALYGLCDLYLEPPRKGGATTTLIAAGCGLPVVLDGDPAPDVLPYLGAEDYVEGQDAYWQRVHAYYRDRSMARSAAERTLAGLRARSMNTQRSTEWAEILQQAAAAAEARFSARSQAAR